MPDDAIPAEIIAVFGRAGTKGVTSVKCRVTDGRDKGQLREKINYGRNRPIV